MLMVSFFASMVSSFERRRACKCSISLRSCSFSMRNLLSRSAWSGGVVLIRQMVQRVLSNGLPKGVCLNVNFPLLAQGSSPLIAYRGVRVCRMAFGTWEQEVTKCHHPRGYDYWWMVGHYRNDEPEATDTDRWALANGYVAVTPTRMDVTAHEVIGQLSQWDVFNPVE